MSSEMFFGLYFWGYIFVINIIYSIIGIILFKLYIGEHKITFSKKYLLLIPSLLMAIYFIFNVIIAFVFSVSMGGMTIPMLIFAIGSPLLLFYYLNQNYNIILFILLIILCFILPVNIFISWIEVMGLIGGV
jgi:hypothetical protein